MTAADGPLIKWLNADGTPCNGGRGQWFLPSGKRPGKWMPKVPAVPCQSGYHVCTVEQAVQWIGPAAWLVEVKGEVVDHGDKLVAEQARLIRRLNWDDRTARLFAADCAERVLPIYEKAYPGDDRPRNAIVAARAYANGEVTAAAQAAARAAARAAAQAAAQDAAWAAAQAAAQDAAQDAAWAAARAAAWAAARAAAGAAAQDAAWAAAQAAAQDAAGAAAWAAARAAAWAAARAAAGAAAGAWQTNHLAAIIGVEQ